MITKYSVTLDRMIADFSFEALYLPKDASNLKITSKQVNRPGLLLSVGDDYFDASRVQFLGLAEIGYLNKLSKNKKKTALRTLTEKQPPLILITRNLDVPPCLLELANEYSVPVLRTDESTSDIMNALITYLNNELAERITRHGVFVEVYGVGVLIVGESGIGKSETAVELIKRGHRLIADDAVELRRIDSNTIMGFSPQNIRHFIELRGVGVINAARLFGAGSVKISTELDLVVQLEPWESSKVYDRLGLDEDYTDILGVKVQSAIIPVNPGRNMAIIIETAAMNSRQKYMGYNAAEELLEKLGMGEITSHGQEIHPWGDE
ncbi:MAG: HPr(Ser) kinase/phosphatase [Candidatus Fimenecus sp.]